MKSFLYLVMCSVLFYVACDRDSDAMKREENDISLHDIFLTAEVIKEWVDHGADINEKDSSGGTLLHEAVRIAVVDPNVVDCLLNLGANPNVADSQGLMLIEIAISMGENEKVMFLLDHGALLPIQDKEKHLLNEAIQYCSADVIVKILKRGDAPLLLYMEDRFGLLPVQNALAFRNIEMASIILDHMDLNHRYQYGDTLLHLACSTGNVDLIKLLLEKGGNVNVKNDQGLTPLQYAKNYQPKNRELQSLLTSAGALEVRAETPQMNEPFPTEQSFIDELMTQENLQERDINDATFLHQAAELGYENAVRYLLVNNADVDAIEKHKFTPLHVSVMNQNNSVARLLIDSGANLRMVDKFGRTPLHWAVMLQENPKKYAVIQLLIDSGSPINGTENSEPPAFAAVGTKNNKALEMLIGNNADVNLFNKSGESLLLRAVRSDNPEAFRILLKNGANIHREDTRGLTVVDYISVDENSVNKQKFMEILKEISGTGANKD